MNDKIAISDAKEVRVEIGAGVDFEDVDLTTDEEREALKAEIDDDPPTEAEQKAAEGKEAEEAAKKAADDAKAAADKATEDKAAEDKTKADEKAAADQAKADEATKKSGQEAADADEAAKKKAFDEEAETAKAAAEAAEKKEATEIAPEPIAPAFTLAGMSPEDLKGVKDSLEDAKKRFSEGEIDYNEYLDERDALNQKLWTHDLAMQLSVESVDSRWEWEQESFLTSKDNEWINNDDVVYSAFAATVNRLMSTEEGAIMPGPQLLDMAREEVASRFSPTQPQEKAKTEEDKKKEEALAAAKAKEANKQPPETLGGKPTAEIDDGIQEFDWIDKLDGEAYETAVGNLTEAQLKRYEASI